MGIGGQKLYSCHSWTSKMLLENATTAPAPAGSCGLCNLLRQLRFNYKRATNCQAGLTMTIAFVSVHRNATKGIRRFCALRVANATAGQPTHFN